MPGPSLFPSWLKKSPNPQLEEKPLQEEDWMTRAVLGGVAGEPGGGWPGLLTGLATSGGLGTAKALFGAGKAALAAKTAMGAKMGGESGMAMMLPFLRGNKELQATRLKGLKIPGPSDSVLNQQFEVLKNKYPRLMSHYTEVNANAPDEVIAQIKSSVMPKGRIPPEVIQDSLGPTKDWAAQLEVHPNMLESKSPLAAQDTLRHETAHLAQNLKNKEGTPKTRGFDASEMYQIMNNQFGYENNPFERFANQSGVKGTAHHILGERIKEIPANKQTDFIDWLNSDPSLTKIRSHAASLSKRPGLGHLTPKVDEMYTTRVEDLFDIYKSTLQLGVK